MGLPTPEILELSRLLLPIQPDDHVQGPDEAPFTLVEYGDYECPGCGNLFTVLQRLQEQLKPNLRFAYRHYPRSGVHPHAQMAAEAAEAAGVQGRFWEMHDLLFEHQNALEKKDLLRYATQLSLDSKLFQNELKHRTHEDRVREDFRRGVQNGVYTTPGLFVNGIRYSGELDFDSLLQQIEGTGPKPVEHP